jgi:hypothetical protein
MPTAAVESSSWQENEDKRPDAVTKQQIITRVLPGPAVADWATELNSRGLLRTVSGLAGNTDSIFCEGPTTRCSQWMSGSAPSRNPAERLNRKLMTLQRYNARSQRANGYPCPT